MKASSKSVPGERRTILCLFNGCLALGLASGPLAPDRLLSSQIESCALQMGGTSSLSAFSALSAFDMQVQKHPAQK